MTSYQCVCLSGTFPAGSPLDEDHRWLLQLLRPPADPLQLADIPVRHPVASTHRVGAFADTHPALASPPDRAGVPHPAGHRALQPLSAHRVSELPAAAAGFALGGRAHRAALAGVERLSRLAVRWEPGTHRLVTASGTSDGKPAGALSISRRGREGEDYAQH